MKKSFMNNIKNFVDSNVRQRIDRTANNINQFYDNDLILVERQLDDLKDICVEAEKRISALLQSLNTSSLGAYTQNVQASLNNLSSNLSASSSATTTTTATLTSEESYSKQSIRGVSAKHCNNESPTKSNSNISDGTDLRNEIRQHKKLPVVGFLKFLVKTCHKSKPDSLLSTTLLHCSELQTILTKLYLSYEQTVESQCLKPLQQILEIDVPNVIKLKKLFIKSHYDLETVKAKYNGASQKQQQQQLHTSHFSTTSYTITQSSVQQANVNKLDQLRKELDDAVTRFEQTRDTYATELYTFVCRESELANLFVSFYQYQADYQQQVTAAIQSSLPPLTTKLAVTPRKVVFGTPLEEQLRCTGRSLSLVIELCVHLLYSNGLNEEGLFRIPGSSVKIKKLRSAINAWFVTLANQDELGTCIQHRPSNSTQASVIAISNLFNDIVAHPQLEQSPYVGGSDTITSGNSNQSTPTPNHRDYSNTHLDSSFQNRNHLVFDVHSIAGLLKLYLRELPEPLFTYALYDQLIEASVKNERIDTDLCTELLIKVIEQLPKTNYENVKHLIRFLHLLTSHCETNKMTAANLAITMAPSLIWVPDTEQQQQQSSTDQLSATDNQQDDMQALSIQMSNIGIKASLHAFVIENLIKNAEKLFPGQVDFTFPELENTPLAARIDESNQFGLKQSRYLKSVSPTGLSTASSSSFSSTSNTSIDLTSGKQHSRKGGSMDGLLNNEGGSLVQSGTIRPMSVNLKQGQPYKQKPPPVPPAPIARSHSRQVGSSSGTLQAATKSQAPSIPPTSRGLIHNSSVQAQQQQLEEGIKSPSTAVSLRGTGSVPVASTGISSNNPNASRPSVPPPNRPPKLKRDNKEDDVLIAKTEETDLNGPQSDNKSSHSLASSGNFRADFEEINPVDIEDLDTSELVSPVVSLDSISGDDGSLSNDSQSIENSWTECTVEQEHSRDTQPGKLSTVSPKPNRHPMGSDWLAPIEAAEQQQASYEPEQKSGLSQTPKLDQVDAAKNLESPSSGKPPVKPPRCISPKITQSTPL